jgi:hypothetical protein
MTQAIDPKLQCKLESLFGPDPLNPCADLAGMGSDILKRIHFLQTEINSLKTTYNNINLGVDRFLGLTHHCGEYVTSDSDAMDAIHNEMNGKEWDSDTFDAIAEFVRQSHRPIYCPSNLDPNP